jgi:hypothetical protein
MFNLYIARLIEDAKPLILVIFGIETNGTERISWVFIMTRCY